MDQYEKWGWCTSRAAGGGTKGPSSPVSCQWLLEKLLHPGAPTTDLLIRGASFCPHCLPTLSLWHSQWEKKSLIGYFQDYFLWMDNIKTGSQMGKPLTDSLLSEIRNVWIPNLNPSKCFHEPVQALCNELNTEIIPQSSEHLQQVRRQEQHSRAETLTFQQQHELWFVQLVLTGKTGYRRHKGERTQPQRCQVLMVTFHRGTPWLCDQLSVQLKGQALLKVFSLPLSNVNLCQGVFRDFTRFPAFHRDLLQTSSELWKTIPMI